MRLTLDLASRQVRQWWGRTTGRESLRQKHFRNQQGELVPLADHVIYHCVATLQRRSDFAHILSNALKPARLRRKFGYARIRRLNVLVDLGDAAELVLEIHEVSLLQ